LVRDGHKVCAEGPGGRLVGSKGTFHFQKLCNVILTAKVLGLGTSKIVITGSRPMWVNLQHPEASYKTNPMPVKTCRTQVK